MATCSSFMVSVAYAWSGVLQPVNADGSSVFKLGSTVPVTFQLTGPSGSTYPDGTAINGGTFKNSLLSSPGPVNTNLVPNYASISEFLKNQSRSLLRRSCRRVRGN